MKNIYTILTVMILSFTGCNILDVDDLSKYGPDVWDDPKLTSAFLTDIYASTFSGGWPMDGAQSDECIGITGKDAVQPNNGSFKVWLYSGIRDVNTLLLNVELGKLPKKDKELMKGQAYFLRAFQYFKMLRVHGGVPIIKVPQTLEDDLNVKRNSSAECFDFILQDLDSAAMLLPVKNKGGDYGRVDQCITAAFRSRVLLYKASPQFNPNNPYDNAYWKDAFDAASTAKKLLDEQGYGLVDNYTDIFETKLHKEVILPFIFSKPSKLNGRGENGLRPLSESKNATGYDQPTWGFAEAFPMKDGKKIGESEKYSYDIQSFWENRDPRFEAIMVHNGDIYELSSKTGRRQYTAAGIALSVDAFGYNIQGEYFSRTGLYCKKGIMEELLAVEVALNDIDWQEIRYPEVLFNYAEAANETGSTTEGYETLYSIRKRAGIEPGADNSYGLKLGMSQDEMRLALLDEKRVEFSFEGQRYWDLRRHRMLHTYLDGQHKFGMLAELKAGVDVLDAMDRASKYTLLPEEFDYEVIDLKFQNQAAEFVMCTPESHYFFPISKSEIEKNPNLIQNKNWGGDFDPTL